MGGRLCVSLELSCLSAFRVKRCVLFGHNLFRCSLSSRGLWWIKSQTGRYIFNEGGKVVPSVLPLPGTAT